MKGIIFGNDNSRDSRYRWRRHWQFHRLSPGTTGTPGTCHRTLAGRKQTGGFVGQRRGIRRQGRHAAEARLAIEAIARWPTLEQELDADLHYRQGGNLGPRRVPVQAWASARL